MKFVCLLLGFLLIFASAANADDSKIALIIGNSAYEHAHPLPNPGNDAADVATLLSKIGFDVTLVTDLKHNEAPDILVKFAKTAKSAAIALIYYAGHGIQVNGENYLIPVDSEISDEADLQKLIRVDDVLQDAGNAKHLAVVILDACRNNPFVRSIAESKNASRSVSVDPGLARVERVPRGTLVAYSTQAGNVASDGSGRNSPYAIALLQHLDAENKDVRMVFGAVRDSVLFQTKQRQEPFIYGSLGGDPEYLFKADQEAVPTSTPPTTKAALSPMLVAAKDIVLPETGGGEIDERFAHWEALKQRNNWQELKKLSEGSEDNIYGYVAARLIEGKKKNNSRTIKAAIQNLATSPVDLSTLPRPVIEEVQRALKDTNFFSGETTGVADDETNDSLKAFIAAFTHENQLTLYSLLALCELGDRGSFSEAMSGLWKGRYYYPYPVNGVADVPFKMKLIISQGRISGFSSEPNTFGDKTSKNLYAEFNGKVMGNTVDWIKKYDGTGGVNHSVHYSGLIDRKKNRIEGNWIIRENWNGRFYIDLAK